MIVDRLVFVKKKVDETLRVLIGLHRSCEQSARAMVASSHIETDAYPIYEHEQLECYLMTEHT